MKKYGYFGGTFDPIHFGHLNLAIQIAEICKLDEVFICPTSVSPSKVDASPIASNQDRFEMTSLAIKDIPFLKMLDFEIKENKPSYTIDTIQKLQEFLGKKDEAFELHLIMASDLWKDFFHWKEWEKLAMIAPPIIGSRFPEKISKLPVGHVKIPYQVVEIPLIEISSTLVRKRLKNKQYCGHLVPHEVLQYIKKKHLYI